MVETRRFARFRGAPLAGRPHIFPLPDDGLCLSTFLLLSPPGRPGEILLGRMNPVGPWEEAAALDPERVAAFRDGWVLPACQLLFFEGPDDAAHRVAIDLLGRSDLSFRPPEVFSEAYARPNAGAHDPHWDLHFVYRAEWPGGDPADSRGRFWSDLRFVDIAATPRTAFARAHGDILALAGLPPRGPSAP